MECVERGRRKERGEEQNLENLDEGEEKTYKRERAASITHERKAEPSGKHGMQSGRAMAYTGARSPGREANTAKHTKSERAVKETAMKHKESK